MPENNKNKILIFLFRYFKVLGFLPYTIDKYDIIKRSKAATIYTALLVIGYSVTYIRITVSRLSFMRALETPLAVIADCMGLGLEYIEIITIWLYSIIYYNEIKSILKLFLKTIKCTSASMGIEISNIYNDILREMYIVLIALNMFFITVVGFDHVICYLEVEDFDLFLWITFNYPRMVTLNFMMIYVYSLKIIRRQFYFINKSISCLPEVYVDKNNISVEINNIM